MSELSTFLEQIVIYTGHLLILGDFDFHADRPSDTAARKFLDLLNAFYLVQYVKEPTHTSGHTLDSVITRSSETIVRDLATQDAGISDHEAVIFTLHLQKPSHVVKTI